MTKQNNYIKMTKEELVKILVANFKDERGNLNLSRLDFTNQGVNDVDISKMKVKGKLFQHSQEVEGGLYQDK